MDDEVVKLLAERCLKKQDISDWAIKCLEKSFDSKSLRMLASTTKFDSPFQTDDYFSRALKELGWEKIDKQNYLMRYAEILAQEIIEEKIDPIKAARDIYQILISSDYPLRLQAWFDVDDMIWDYEHFVKTGEKYYHFRPKDELISEIKRFSKQLVDSI